MSYDIILQARYNSKRLQGKILYSFGGKTFIEFLIKNLKKIKNVRHIIVASPHGEKNKIFKKISKKNKIKFFSSKKIKENDLLSRYYLCAKKFNSVNIIRITSDCPFINNKIIEKMIAFHSTKKIDFLTNNKPRRLPLGFDCEILSYKILKKIYNLAKLAFDREHVTPYIYKKIFVKKLNNIKILQKNYSKLRLTLDYYDDYIFFKRNKKILEAISKKSNYEYYLKKLLKQKKWNTYFQS